ncbi:MAG TPA: FG-GAP-like repeat-containing protein [Desulfobacterales bacterium]|nr:FG-GAP-like repeat-containing protein [Desulfobacterales bacterium]
MKTTCYTTFRIFLLGMIVFIFIFGIQVHAAAKPVQVAVVPFKVNAEKDLSFLRDGIVDMLSSRLSWADKVTVVNSQETLKALKTVAGPLNEVKAREMGTKLDADFVLFGSLTVIGNSVSIDAKMVDVSGEKETLSFFNQSQGMDPVIPAINVFASDINEKKFGRVMPSQKTPAASQAQQTQTLQDQPQSDARAHPEKLIVGGYAGGETQETQNAAPGSAFIATQMSKSQSAQFWKSRNIKQRITGVALGDIDKDGKTETVMITDHSVEAYRFDHKRFLKIKTIAERSHDYLIGVDVADINGNGYPEIFVTALNPSREFVKSFVLEFDGKTYIEIVKKSNWYFRTVETPERGRILLGQKQGINSPFDDRIYELVWQNSEYDAAEPVMPPRRANVLGLASGDARNDGTQVAVLFDKLDYLRIYDSKGDEIWKDGEHSGGTPRYFQMPNLGSKDTENHAYYPMRILIRDINKDGKNDVITAKNYRLSQILSARMFQNGELEIRSWDGIGLAVLWRTRKLSGHISDFAIGDFDNDGADELVAALVIKTGAVAMTTPKSALIAYELQ